MRISEVSKITGLSYDTIRYYEKLNLFHSELKNKRREYNQKHVELLNSIQLLKQASFSLKEIQYFIELDNKFKTMDEIQNMNDSDFESLKRTIEVKRQQVESSIEKMIAAKQLLLNMEIKISRLERE